MRRVSKDIFLSADGILQQPPSHTASQRIGLLRIVGTERSAALRMITLQWLFHDSPMDWLKTLPKCGPYVLHGTPMRQGLRCCRYAELSGRFAAEALQLQQSILA